MRKRGSCFWEMLCVRPLALCCWLSPSEGLDNGPQGAGQEKCPTEESQEGVEGKRVSLSSSFSQDSWYPWLHFPTDVFLKPLTPFFSACPLNPGPHQASYMCQSFCERHPSSLAGKQEQMSGPKGTLCKYMNTILAMQTQINAIKQVCIQLIKSDIKDIYCIKL